jgi:hypothetical protein
MKKEGSPMEQYYVGLDVHSRQSTFVIEDGAGRVTAQGEVPTTPAGLAHLRAAHRLPPDAAVALETGTVAFFVARQLAAIGLAAPGGRCARGAAQGPPADAEE